MKLSSCVYVPSKNILKCTAIGLSLLGCSLKTQAQNYIMPDNGNDPANYVWYPKTTKSKESIIPYDYKWYYGERQKQITTPKGILASENIKFPSPKIVIAGDTVNAAIVVDISNNILYKYDENGKPIKAYLVATGRKSMPTKPGIRRVTHKENYPYRWAPEGSKRRETPRDFGPKIICLTVINHKTGASRGADGQFIHGNNSKSSIGKHISHGCVRMDNEAILEVAENIKSGMYVLFAKFCTY